jgi:hypothetical protein
LTKPLPLSLLKLVESAPEPAAERVRRRVKALDKPPSMLECRCGSRELLEVKVGVLWRNGRAYGGTKQLICAACLANGERVVLA